MKQLLVLLCAILSLFVKAQQTLEVDVCIYGGSSAGVIAAYTAKKLNKTVILIEPGKRLGGLTTGGLGYTDIGNKYVITGLARDFYRRIGRHYGKFEQWIFEPSVAEKTMLYYINAARVPVWYSYRLNEVKKDGTTITSITVENAENPATANHRTIKAKMFLDCTYEGDLMAKAGVSYTIGREANRLYGETYNGVQLMDKHQFPDGIDPYKVPGNAASGLLWGISPEPLAPNGTGDEKVQTYNFRICLTNKPENRLEITQPDGYDPSRYELLVRYLQKRPAKNLNDRVLDIDMMPNGKTDINNNGPISTDMIGVNHGYPEASYAQRMQLQKEHEAYNKGLLFFLGHDERVPEHLRKEMLQWGYPKDEYADNGHWSPQMYVREARRMIGSYVMTQANCEGKKSVPDGVGMAAYTMDSHNCQRIVKDGMVKNEGDVQIGGFGPYPVAYRCLIPKKEQCTNLLVPVCLSASHIAYGSIRMEPVFMVLAQSSATAAVQAINNKTSIQDIDIKKLQQQLKADPLADGSVAEILVDNDDAANTELSGNWEREKGGYGPSLIVSEGSNGASSIKFTPQVTTAGKYTVYAYFPKLQGMSPATAVTVFDGMKEREVIINEKDIRVEGQTSGEWVDLGAVQLQQGQKAYVKISNKNSTGKTVADAILFVPEKR